MGLENIERERERANVCVWIEMAGNLILNFQIKERRNFKYKTNVIKNKRVKQRKREREKKLEIILLYSHNKYFTYIYTHSMNIM